MSQECATGCGRPTGGSALCHGDKDRCEERLVQQIAELPAQAAELDITATRQSVITNGNGGSRSAEHPIPWDRRAARAKAALRGHAWRWVMLLWDKSEPLPTGGLATMGRWLHARINRILDHPAVGDLANDIRRATSRAWAAVDRPADKIFAGICSEPTDDGPCIEWLYATPGRPMLTCRACGTHHDVKKRRETLRSHVEDVLATAAEVSRAVVIVGEHVRLDQITRWRETGRLQVRGHVTDGGKDRPIYRIGDVLDLAHEHTTKKAEKAS